MDVLIVISKWEHTQKRASMLKDMHFRNLSQKVRHSRSTLKYIQIILTLPLSIPLGYALEKD